MKLHFKKIGSGQPLIILHGLFGLLDNWQSMGKQLAEEGFEVYLVDQRNHGHSPHSDEWNYEVMSDDILELLNDNGIDKAILLGHSMGGKTAMHFAIKHPERMQKLIVIDIAPKHYPVHHDKILEALNSLDLETTSSRKQAEEHLSKYISENDTKQFLLKNIYWDEEPRTKNQEPRLAWRFNLSVITKNIENVGEASPQPSPNERELSTLIPTVFIRGERSDYILDEDMKLIHDLFPSATLETIPGAGHWVHAEKPKEFYECVMKFIH